MLSQNCRVQIMAMVLNARRTKHIKKEKKKFSEYKSLKSFNFSEMPHQDIYLIILSVDE